MSDTNIVSPRPGGFCTSCGFEVESFEGLDKCPSCDTDGIPCKWSNQIDININWHELRILVMWAEFHWNKSIKDGNANPIYSIVERIRKQHPERISTNPLTLASEVQQIVDSAKFGKVEHNVPGVEGGFNPNLTDTESSNNGS